MGESHLLLWWMRMPFCSIVRRQSACNLATQIGIMGNSLFLPQEQQNYGIMSWLIILWLLGFFDRDEGDDWERVAWPPRHLSFRQLFKDSRREESRKRVVTLKRGNPYCFCQSSNCWLPEFGLLAPDPLAAEVGVVVDFEVILAIFRFHLELEGIMVEIWIWTVFYDIAINNISIIMR